MIILSHKKIKNLVKSSILNVFDETRFLILIFNFLINIKHSLKIIFCKISQREEQTF